MEERGGWKISAWEEFMRSEPHPEGGALTEKENATYPTLNTIAAPVSPAAQPAHRP